MKTCADNDSGLSVVLCGKNGRKSQRGRKGKGRERREGDVRKLERLDKVVLNALLDTHARADLVVHDAESEGERTGLLGEFREGSAGSLHLEEVGRGGLREDGVADGVGGLGLQGGV